MPTPAARRIVVIADPTRESWFALQWALSHVVLEQDQISLLHMKLPPASSRRTYFRRPACVAVAPRSPFGSTNVMASTAGKGKNFLDAMRAECERVQPKVRVQMMRIKMDGVEMDGKNKAAGIMAHTDMFGADLLVIGQRRISTILGCKLGGGVTGKPDTAEILIEKSKCLCVGVQKKGQNAGYLLNTKNQKNFWLLA